MSTPWFKVVCMSTTDDIIRLIGEDAFGKLCAVFGGMNLVMYPSVERRIAAVIGNDLARRLVDEYAYDHVALPMETPSEKLQRRGHELKRVKDLRSKGMKVNEIAVCLDTTERNVRMLLKQSK